MRLVAMINVWFLVITISLNAAAIAPTGGKRGGVINAGSLNRGSTENRIGRTMSNVAVVNNTFPIDLNQTVTFEHQGTLRKYALHLPISYGGEMLPLVLVLHAEGGSAEEASQKYEWMEKSDKESFLLVFPEALPLTLNLPAQFSTNPTYWNDGSSNGKKIIDDISYLRKTIEDVVQRFSVDRQRIYMTGFSNGASMTFRAGIELSEILAAIAPISGYLWLKDPKPKKAMSLLLITGDADPIAPLAGGPARSLWSARQEVKPSVEGSIKAWLPLIQVKEVQKKSEKTTDAMTTIYGPNQKGVQVVFSVIADQGHEWPGGKRIFPEKLTGKNSESFKATDVIWDFFKSRK